MKKSYHLLLLSALLLSAACQQTPTEQSSAKAVTVSTKGNKFNDYWYQGNAEITTYDLEQARYGEIHQGHSTMIFVTEEFSKSKQVKLDNPGAVPKDAVPILKLNRTSKFNTGLYPYSMMASVFTPIDGKKYPHSLKVSSSSQEWCGHTFMQINEKRGNYAVQLNSYFESEGDRDFKVDKVLLEDEVWTKLRIDPKALPTGKTKILPGTFFSRLKHTAFEVQEANISMSPVESDASLMAYRIDYPALKRTLTIHFKKDFPHQIHAWEDTYGSGWGAGAKSLTTRATLRKSIKTDYWTKNSNADAGMRADLGLE